MSNVEHAKVREAELLLAAVGLLAILLVACSGPGNLEVSAAAPPKPPPVTTAELPGSTFQGPVASIDPATGELIVAVHIVWAPVLRAERHDRRVIVTSGTRWEPDPSGLAALHVGDEVQVEAVGGSDGTWLATKISLFDID